MGASASSGSGGSHTSEIRRQCSGRPPRKGPAVGDRPKALPKEMIAEFKKNPEAWAFHESQPSGYRKQTTAWVTSAKREETRQRRLATLIDDSANGLRIKQLRRE